MYFIVIISPQKSASTQGRLTTVAVPPVGHLDDVGHPEGLAVTCLGALVTLAMTGTVVLAHWNNQHMLLCLSHWPWPEQLFWHTETSTSLINSMMNMAMLKAFQQCMLVCLSHWPVCAQDKNWLHVQLVTDQGWPGQGVDVSDPQLIPLDSSNMTYGWRDEGSCCIRSMPVFILSVMQNELQRQHLALAIHFFWSVIKWTCLGPLEMLPTTMTTSIADDTGSLSSSHPWVAEHPTGLTDVFLPHSPIMDMAPSMSESSPKGKDSELWDKTGGRRTCLFCAFWLANCSLSLKSQKDIQSVMNLFIHCTKAQNDRLTDSIQGDNGVAKNDVAV